MTDDTNETGKKNIKAWLEAELEETLDETLEAELSEPMLSEELRQIYKEAHPDSLDRRVYLTNLLHLQAEFIKMQSWVEATGAKLLIIFEGRDSAGKGGVIKRITQRLNPRTARVVALQKPSEREQTQWYFQRYVPHLPSGGEIVMFDRSWYNRAGVERVMGFADDGQVERFFQDVPEFERMLVRNGIIVLKYWLSITDEEQQLRFMIRIHDPMKQWKLSPMDLQSRVRWEHYTKAKEDMFTRTSIPKRLGISSKGTTRSANGSTVSSTFCRRFPIRKSPTKRSSFRTASSILTTTARRCRPICTCRRSTEPRRIRAGRTGDFSSAYGLTPARFQVQRQTRSDARQRLQCRFEVELRDVV